MSVGHVRSLVDVPAAAELAPVTLGRHFRITPSGLTVIGRPSFEACEQLWEALLTLEKSIQFAIGDAMRVFREMWGERAAQIVSDRTGWALETLRAYEWTAEHVAATDRMMDRGLTFSHHQVAAALPPGEQRRWLMRAAAGNGEGRPWTVSQLRSAIKDGSDVEEIAFWVLVRVADERAQTRLADELSGRGFSCRPVRRSGKSA